LGKKRKQIEEMKRCSSIIGETPLPHNLFQEGNTDTKTTYPKYSPTIVLVKKFKEEKK